MDAIADTNGKVTLAVIKHRLDEVCIKLDKMTETWEKRYDDMSYRVSTNERGLAVSQQDRQDIHRRIDDVEDEVKDVKKLNTFWSGINSALAVIAGALGITINH
jgi:predicted NACHT family NTPase